MELRVFVWQHLPSLVCSLGVGTTGIALAWYAPLMVYLVSAESPIPMTTRQSSWLASSIHLGCLSTALPANILSDRVGRKYPLLAIGPVVAISYLLLAFIRSLTLLFVLRIVHGMCMGVAYGCGPIYIAEVSEPNQRGTNSSHLMVMFYAGCLFSYSWGPYVSYTHYALICVIPSIIFTASFIWMPESPYFLLVKGRTEKARHALTMLRGGKLNEEEFKHIEESVKRELEEKGSWKDLFTTPKDRKNFFIVQMCSLIKYSGGIPSFLTYLSQTFKESHIQFLDSHQLTIVVGVLLTVSTMGSCIIGDKIGRRPMLIYTSLLVFLFQFTMGLYYFLDFNTSFHVDPYVWILFIAIIGFIFSTNVGIGPLMQTIQAEFFCSKTRGVGGGVSMFVGSSTAFICIKMYQVIEDAIGVFLNNWIYAGMSLFGAFFIYFLLPETAGRSLGEIQVDMKQRASRASIRR